MSFVLEIITPEGIAYTHSVNSVGVPTVDGEIGILTGHIPLLTLLKAGQLKVLTQEGAQEFLAVDRGFARVWGNRLSILTEAAIHMVDIDLDQVEQAEKRAQQALEDAKNHPHMDPAQIEKIEAIMRFAVAQRLVKKRDY